MKTKPAKPSERKPKARHAPGPVKLRTRVKTFHDGSALILDTHGGIIGLIEAQPRYRVRKITHSHKATSRPQ
jgi:hypothetical protein